jgi:hypothetical protein
VIADTTPGPHRTDSDDIAWWLPILGPTSSWLAFLLARHATIEAQHCWETDLLARTVGLAGNQSKLWASLDRLDRFAAGHFQATDVLTVRLRLPALSERQLAHLPRTLAEAYRRRVYP